MLQLRQRGICTVVWASTSCWGEGLGVALMAEQLLIVRVLSVLIYPFPWIGTQQLASGAEITGVCARCRDQLPGDRQAQICWLVVGSTWPSDEALRWPGCACPSHTLNLLGGWLGEAAMRLLGLTQKSPCLRVGNVLLSGSRGQGALKGASWESGAREDSAWDMKGTWLLLVTSVPAHICLTAGR